MRNVYMEEDAENIMDGEKDQRLGAHGNWNREGRDTTTNSAKSKAEVLWTCHAIRWFGKGYDVSIWRGKEKTRKTKEKVDGRDTLNNRNELGRTERCDDGQKEMEGLDQDGR